MLPTNHALHETLEITHGFNDWFETGFYVFSSASSLYGWDWVGDHIRPRVAAPGSHGTGPSASSLSVEFGYQQKPFSPDTWTLEIRPIIDKTIGPLVPLLQSDLRPLLPWPERVARRGVLTEFQAGLRLHQEDQRRDSNTTDRSGRFPGFDPVGEQQQQIVPCIDLNLGAQWEFNFGVGIGLTHSTDHLLTKMILGRRFNWGRHEKAAPLPPPDKS